MSSQSNRSDCDEIVVSFLYGHRFYDVRRGWNSHGDWRPISSRITQGRSERTGALRGDELDHGNRTLCMFFVVGETAKWLYSNDKK